MCPQGNTIELVLPSAHPSPQPKREIEWFSRFCTAHGRMCLYFTMRTLSLKNAPSRGGIGTPIYFMIAGGRPNPQSKLHHDRLSYFRTGDRRVSLYFTMGAIFPQNCLFPRGIWTPRKTRFLGPIRAHRPNGISISSAVFEQTTAIVSLYFTLGRPFPPQNCPFPWEDVDPHLTHGSLGPPESSTQMASRSVQPF